MVVGYLGFDDDDDDTWSLRHPQTLVSVSFSPTQLLTCSLVLLGVVEVGGGLPRGLGACGSSC